MKNIHVGNPNPYQHKPMSIESFIQANPYPTYEEMEVLQTMRFDLDAEYGLNNHDWCKHIYETMHIDDNRRIVDEWILDIKRSGGSQALKCNLETLRLFSPIAKCEKCMDEEAQIVFHKFADIYDYVTSNL